MGEHIRTLNRNYQDSVKNGKPYHTFLHEELSETLMYIWENRHFLSRKDIDDIISMYDITTDRRARAENGWWYSWEHKELNIALMSIWKEQETGVPTKEFINKLKKYNGRNNNL